MNKYIHPRAQQRAHESSYEAIGKRSASAMATSILALSLSGCDSNSAAHEVVDAERATSIILEQIAEPVSCDYSQGVEYEVRPGDTLAEIIEERVGAAGEYLGRRDVSIEAVVGNVALNNGINNPDFIVPGEIINLPYYCSNGNN